MPFFNFISNTKYFLCFLLIVFNILFPKCGIKVSGIPVTVGNVIFFIAILYLLLLGGFKTLLKIESVILLLIYYWSIRLCIGYYLGDDEQLSQFASLFMPLCVYPLVFFVIVRYIDNNDILNNVITWLKFSVWFVVIYSVFQFLFGIGATTIPFLSVNYSDYAEAPDSWWLQKFNGSGESIKIVSTYQNGNLLGANLLLLCPFVYRMINNQYLKNVFVLLAFFSVIVAGSRSMYVGLFIFLFYKLCHYLLVNKTIKKISILSVLFSIVCVIAISIFFFNNVSNSFLNRIISVTDVDVLASGQGRVDKFLIYLQWMLSNDSIMDVIFGSYGVNYRGGAFEMLYASLFVYGGLVGLGVTLYSIIYLLRVNYYNNYILNAIIDGMILYAIAAVSEGSFWLPPLALNLWIMIGLYERVSVLCRSNLS